MCEKLSGLLQDVKRIYITDRISYIKASEEPLSADVGIIEGEEYLYLFDVGNNEEVAKYLDSLPKKKKIILSHFHSDHSGNIGRVKFETVYAGANTEKYFQYYIEGYAAERLQELSGALQEAFRGERKASRYEIVLEPVRISDGISLEIYPVPNSHAKGSLLFQVDGEYIFLGDAIYSTTKQGKTVYNAQLLKEEIKLLKTLPGKKVFISHDKRPVKGKDGIIRFLEKIYEKRVKDESYIQI